MNRLTKKVLHRVMAVVDQLYGVDRQLTVAKRRGEDIGTLVTLVTRLHIYNGCMDVIAKYKRKEDYTGILKRTLKRIRLHISQLKRLKVAETDENIQFLKLLYVLMNSFAM